MLKNDEYKFLYYKERLKGLMDEKIIPPVTVEIGLTTRCTDRCNFCAFDWMMGDKVDLDFESLKKAVDDMSYLKVRGISICGNGEPLLYKNFVELVDYIASKNIQIGLVTNGSLIHKMKDDIDIFKKFTYVRVSLDAGDEATYKKVHGTKNFLNVLEGLKMLVAVSTEQNTIGVHYTLSMDNYDSMYRSLKICRDIGVDYFHIGPIVKSTQNTEGIPNPHLLKDIEIKALENQSRKGFQIFVSRNRFDDVAGLDVTTAGFNKCRAQNFFTIIEAEAYLP